ncbi:hypothetical protein [Algoriphagus aquimarinus]|uniref:hypothetical protein n=1 Tax=Algoriphagus aquimarinus TaxID=237018 RepID=UPI0030DD45E6|tara:strand:+ start:31646 stop:31837 length:192 start_codon:yes stop_codon:yes gene_type:complete
MKFDYEIARFIGYLSIRPHLDKAAATKGMHDLIKFQWDKEQPHHTYKPITTDEFKVMREKFKL